MAKFSSELWDFFRGKQREAIRVQEKMGRAAGGQTRPLTFEERLVGDVVILDLHGILRAGNGDEKLGAAMARLLESGATRLVLNLSDVPSVDSAGLGILVAAYKRARGSGGSVVLLNPTAELRELISVYALTFFDVYESESDAVRALRPGPGT